jgi:7-carboxy-7-deazaguanine synthase
LLIAELFYSLQGEGALVGVPSFFIRTSGCNLRCAWCDTPYASWNPEGTDLPLEQILDEAAAYPTRHVVVTGGEPLIQPEIVPLTERLRARGLHITIETAGTVFEPVACDLMSISPKLANSTPQSPWAARHEELRFRPHVLADLMARYEYQLKFVIAAPDDALEARRMVEVTGADPAKVFLMPEGTDPETLRRRGAWLAEICKQEGYRFSPRLHIELWGGVRGV